jgi:hypothetical protein
VIDTERTLLRDLVQLHQERSARLPELEETVRAKKAEAQRVFDQDYQTAIVEFSAAKDALAEETKKERERILADYEIEKQSAEQEFATARRRVRGRYAKEKHETKTAFQEAQWTLAALLEAKKTEAEDRFKEVQNQVGATMGRLQAIRQESRKLLEHWRMPTEYADGSLLDPADPRTRPKLRRLASCLADAENQLARLNTMRLPRYSKGWRLPGLIFLFWIGSLFPVYALLGTLLGEKWILAVAISGVVAAIVGVIIETALTALARSNVLNVCMKLCRAVADAEPSRQRVLKHYDAVCLREQAQLKRRHDRSLRKAYKEYRARRTASKERRTVGSQQSQDAYERRLAANEWRRTDDLRVNEETNERRAAELQVRYDADVRDAHARHAHTLAEIKARFDDERQTLADRWEQCVARTQTAVTALHAESGRRFPPWTDPAWANWTPPRDFPPAVRFGQMQVRLESKPDGGLTELPDFTLPALLPFPGGAMLLEASDDGRTRAVETLQAVMFRLLTCLPPGKVRFTIVDPVGRGQNFAAFMHLADYDEALVGGRIWTEQGHVEQRLADLTAHMENVIQKYLRDQFATMEAYNVSAGEVAEPFRFLVVANFPEGFSADAVRRLVSIAQSGPRCGVYTLIAVDTKQPMPSGFDLAELARGAAHLAWDGERSPWNDADFGAYPLQLDPPPPSELSMRVLKVVGEQARDAKRVEVPFEFIAPAADQWWTGDSRQGLTVPLGRAGATKRQALALGKGTAQHALVAGKTGSGKSTLLHALITNLSLVYSPDEVELYLVDFKKGVEFKTYATHELPHARVIAIESEREFGLSVLQRLDAELRLRGEKFRNTGVQDLNNYRQAKPGEVMPRILLIVDEFQEFFVEDDRIAQDAAQLLDRLVRQGRAFGLHVLLGSQTLGGAYSLARSTIDQMAVRIALQCSEADAQLILSDDNAAARLLSRPGEAIYNDANGLLEGNNLFQVVWLSDERREEYLREVHERARKRKRIPTPPLVFEGNAPADPSRNALLHDLLHAPSWPTERRAFDAWLGEAVAIKDPTAATFRPMTGANLLVVGQQDEAALGMLATGVVSLAAQLSPVDSAPRFYVLDGSRADARHRGLFARLERIVPHGVRVGGMRDTAAVMAELAEEVERRQKTPDSETTPLFFVIYGLQYFRDLRRAEDDFSFASRGDDKTTPAQQFTTLLREGASLGIHALVWCDTYNNLQRVLDRQALREFDMRALFQMGVADSSNLIDSPLAAKLGLHRALFHSEEQGRLEKFRPYGVPAETWLDAVREQLQSRSVSESVSG